MTTLLRFMRDDSAATAIEYGLLAAVLGVGLIAALSSLKTNLASVFDTVGTAALNASKSAN
jgi:pilus assembly protein Flp/PilA